MAGSSVRPGAASQAPEFVIGVTGHRDIVDTDEDGIRSKLQNVLEEISAHFQHCSLRLVCGMAEGADMLAADVAIEMGIGVTAVLPMPKEHYEDDFEGLALEHFRALSAHPNVRTAEIPLAEGVVGDAMHDQSFRDAQYQLLADYIVRRSNVLVAIWDEVDVSLPGGTSDVVMRYLADGGDQRPTLIDRDDSDDGECGNLIVWLPARRQTDPERQLPHGPVCLISNSNYDCFWQRDEIPDLYKTRWAGFDDYAGERLSDRGTDLPAYGLTVAGDTAQTPDLETLDKEFVRLDQLARAYQIRSDRMFALFGIMAAAMGLAFLVYAKLLADKAFLIFYIALFIGGFLAFRYSARQHLHSRHLAYRALAETFRVQFFLVLSGAGAGYSLRRILGLTSVDRFTRFEWLQEAVRCAEPLVYFGHCNGGDALAQVRKRWMSDQAGYFEKKLHLLHAQHRRLETIKTALLAGSLIGALMLIFFKKTLTHLDMIGYDGKSWLVFFMGLLPLWVAVWELYQGKMATRELLWQYTNQRRYFRAAEREIEQVPGLAEGQKIIRDLADKALIEIYLWSVHRYHREHEPPSAG